MKKMKRDYLKELWWNRPWKYIPKVIWFMKKYPYKKIKKGKRHTFHIWLRNCFRLNWQVCLKEADNG